MSHTDVTAQPTETTQGPSDQTEPRLLTAEEAAALARCSTRTVRRAYASGLLTAYRRRGSRAVLLSNDDVLEWAQGEQVVPARQPLVRDVEPRRLREPRRIALSASAGVRPRFDLSAQGLLDRRASGQ